MEKEWKHVGTSSGKLLASNHTDSTSVNKKHQNQDPVLEPEFDPNLLSSLQPCTEHHARILNMAAEENTGNRS